MKRWIAALSACAMLSTLSTSLFAHGYDAGDAALGGLVGGVVGGLIGSGAVPYPAYLAPAPVVVESAPVVVEHYAPAPMVVEPYAPPPVVVYRPRGRGWHEHEWHEHHWDDDDD